MDISINNKAYEAFSKTAFSSNDAIAKLGAEGSVGESGRLGSVFSRIGRSTAKKMDHNAVRTALLKSLGQAFGIAGMSTTEDGKTTFSPEFVASLEKLLGKGVLKTGDFKIAADGTVSSGKPLTQRRITAILNKAAAIGKAQTFDCGHYEVRLAQARKGLAKLNTKKSGLANIYVKHFDHVESCLKFLKNDLDGLLEENIKWTWDGGEENPNNKFPRYILKQKEYVDDDGKKIPAEDVPIPTKGTLQQWLNMHGPRGLFHVEEYRNISRDIKTPEDKEALINYIKNTLIAYVQGTIDLFLDAQAEGPAKVQELIKAWNSADHACMDAKADVSNTLREKLNLMTDEQLAVKFASSHTSETKLDACIYNEIDLAIKKRTARGLPPAKGWNDLAHFVRKGIVGEKRPIVTLDAGGSLVPLTANGKPVVRTVTAEDIDKIGPACCDTLGIFG